MLLLVKTRANPILGRVASIVPYNAFYTEGDPWSEARRKNMPIPEEVARKYEVCTLELLIEVPNNEVKYPPSPGDLVTRLDPTKHEKDIFGISRGDPKNIWYGSLSGYSKAPVPLNVENIPMHLAIFGVTGSGKSFDTGALIEKLVEIPVGKNQTVSFPMIIVDAHGDYVDYVKFCSEGNKLGKMGWIKRYVFPNIYQSRITDFRKRGSLVSPIGINLDSISQRELAEMIVLFYKGTTEGAELQVDGIEALFQDMKDAGYESIQSMFLLNYQRLLADLDTLATNSGMAAATKSAIRRALETFRTIENRHKLLSTESELKNVKTDRTTGAIEEVTFVEDLTKQGGVAVFDFSAEGAPGVDLKTKQFVMTYLAGLLFEQFTNYKIKKDDRYLMFLIEEAQNFAPDRSYPVSSTLAHSKLAAIATQGRKFGLSLCLISQRPSFLDRIVLSMCNTFLIHRVSPEDVSFVKAVSGGLPTSISNRLTNLDTGDVVITGQMNRVSFPLLVHVPKSDRQVEPTVGQTDVTKNLARLRGIE